MITTAARKMCPTMHEKWCGANVCCTWDQDVKADGPANWTSWDAGLYFVLHCNKKAILFLAEFQTFRSSTIPNVSLLERHFDIWKLCKCADTRLKDASCPKGDTYKYTSNLLLQPFQSYTCWINLVSNPITIVVKWTTWLFQYTCLKKSVCYTW